MGTIDSIDLNPNHLATVKAILAEHVPECEVWAFGSRVTWTAKDYSDLDLVVVGEGPVEWKALGRLKEAFEESKLPMRMDVLDWHTISESFREVIERGYTIVKEKVRGAEAKSGWRETTLDKLGRIVTGKTPSSRNPKYFGGDSQFVTPRDFNGRRRIESTERHLTTRGENAVKGARIPSGAVMMSCIGSDMGKSAITVEPCVTNQQINTVIVDSDNDPLFVYYNLSSRKDEIRASASGSAQPILNKSAFGQLPITMPLLPEQRAIAHVLGTLDDKIELNRRMNETLEEMARALFKSWFVDFEPVHAKMEGCWRRGESLLGLPADLYDLFPDRLVGSELGEIPEGWEVRAFHTLLNDVIGGDWGKENPDAIHKDPVSIIRGTDLPSLSTGGTGSVPLRYSTRKRLERRMLREGDIIIEVSGGSPSKPTGRSMLMTRDVLGRFAGAVVCASFCRRFRPHGWGEALLASRHLDYLYSIGKMWEYQLQSTGIANFQTNRFLKDEKVIWPGDDLLTRFAELVEPLAQIITRNESMTLAAQRDALLPKLVSGEVQVDSKA